MLVQMLIGYRLAACLLCGGRNIATEPVLHRIVDVGVRQDALEGLAFDHACRERVAGDHRGLGAEHDADLRRRELAPIEHAEFRKLTSSRSGGNAPAEVVLPTRVEGEVGSQAST